MLEGTQGKGCGFWDENKVRPLYQNPHQPKQTVSSNHQCNPPSFPTFKQYCCKKKSGNFSQLSDSVVRSPPLANADTHVRAKLLISFFSEKFFHDITFSLLFLSQQTPSESNRAHSQEWLE